MRQPCVLLPARRLLSLFLFLTLVAAPSLAGAKKEPVWDPIAPEDLAATECKAYPGVNTEMLIYRMALDQDGYSQVMRHYRRYKIYNSAGVRSTGVMDLEYNEYSRIQELSARVIKPDGTIKVYGRKDFTESVLLKYQGAKLKALAFAVPDLNSGDIFEVTWVQDVYVPRYYTDSTTWYCQMTIPVREFNFHVESSPTDYSLIWANLADAKIEKNSRYSGGLVARNIPPFEEEPHCQPMRDIRGSFTILYKSSYAFDNSKPDSYKFDLTKFLDREFQIDSKPNGAVKEKAAELTKGLATDEEKLAAIYRFCQEEISNLDYQDSAELQKVKKKLERNRWDQLPGTTLKNRSGTGTHVNNLFAALARAAGFEVQLVYTSLRSSSFQIRQSDGWMFLKNLAIVVHLRDKSIRFYDPASYYVPVGMMPAEAEAAPGLICNAKELVYTTVPVAPANKSPVRRTGRFTLDADGNLEGTVEISYHGHAAVTRKNDWHGESMEKIESSFRSDITRLLPAAEISDLKWTNLSGTALPLRVSYKLKVPGYADQAGDKLIFAPNVFERGEGALFNSEKRTYNIFFAYAFQEVDDIEIALPQGFVIEKGSAPQNVGEQAGIGSQYQLSYKPKLGQLTYKREYVLGGNGSIAFQVASYAALKARFDAINRSDEHTLILSPRGAPAAEPKP